MPPNIAQDSIAEDIVDESAQASRDASQTEPVQVSMAPAASAALYDQFGTDSYSEYTGDAEIFGNLDPSFDLGRADAIFSANLDLSMPYFAEDWPVSGLYTGEVG